MNRFCALTGYILMSTVTMIAVQKFWFSWGKVGAGLG